MLKEEAGGVGTFYFSSFSLIRAQPLSFAHFAIARRDKDQDHAQRSRDGTHEKEGGEDLVHPSNRYSFQQCLFFLQSTEQVHLSGVTCAASGFPILDGSTFPLVILDECSQMLEPHSMIPLARFNCQKLVRSTLPEHRLWSTR